MNMEDVPEDIVAKEREIQMGKEDILSKPEKIRWGALRLSCCVGTSLSAGRVSKSELVRCSLPLAVFLRADCKSI